MRENGTTKKQGFSNGQTSLGYLRVAVLGWLEGNPRGFTAAELKEEIETKTGEIVTEKTAGVILNDIRKGLQGHPLKTIVSFTKRVQKTTAEAYRLSYIK